MKRRVIVPVTNVSGALLKLFILTSLLVFACPVSAGEISLYFDSSGRPLSSISRQHNNGTKSSRPELPEGTEPLGNVTYENYPVSGNSFSEIMRSVKENGPYNDMSGKRLPWKADWMAGLSYQYSYTYGIDEVEGKVHSAIEISGIELQGTGTITLPLLIDDSGLNPVEKNLWRSYLATLATHCHDIISIVRDPDIAKTAREKLGETNYLIFDYTEGLDVDSAVGTFLTAEASKAGKDWVKEIKARIAAYEKITASGARPEKRKQFFRKSRGSQ